MQNFGVTNKEHYGMLWFFSEMVNIERGVLYCKQKIGDKIVEILYSNRVTTGNKRIHTPPLSLHSKIECLLFYIETSNSGTTLHGVDGGGKAFIYPLEVSKTSKGPLMGRSVSTNFKS